MTVPSITDDLLAEIEAAAEAATPGPGEWDDVVPGRYTDASTILALIARVRELEKDAGRYRFIRGKFGYGPHGIFLPMGPNRGELAQETDTAIDQAMQGDV